MKNNIEQYKADLKKALLNMHSSISSQKTWTAEDVGSIMKGQTDKTIWHMMQYYTADEYANLLSL